jgi:hypothetical protein
MTNADVIRNMTNDELNIFIRMVYLCGKNGYGFSFCDYNLESWLEKVVMDEGSE